MSSIRSLSAWSMDGSGQPREIGGADPQILKTLGTPVRRAITAPGNGCSPSSTPMAPGVRSWKATPSPKPKPSCFWPTWAGKTPIWPRRGSRLYSRKTAPRGRLGHVSGRKTGHQQQRGGLFRPETHRPRTPAPNTCSGPARRFSLMAEPMPLIATPASFWPFWDKSLTNSARPSPRKSCFCPNGSPSIFMTSAHWSRTIIVPLSIVSAFQPVREIDPRLGIRELFIREPENWPPLRCPGLKGGAGLLSWDRFFRTIDSLWKWCRRHRFLPLRRRAIDAAKKWMLERFQESDGLGAIYPPIVWSILALKCLGYADDSPEVLAVHQAIGRPGDRRPGKRHRPRATLQIAGLGYCHNSSGLVGRRHWQRYSLYSQGNCLAFKRQISRPGDWAEKVKVEPGGWCFEYANAFYPDVDDTVMTLMALHAHLNDGLDTSGSLPPALRLIAETDDCEDEVLP